jgi:hypothetical protein
MFERIKQRAKLIRPLLIPFIFYIGLLAFSLKWLEENPDSSWRIAVALLPLIPGIFIALGIVRAILQLDELERRILLEGIAFSFAMTFILVLSFGLLDIAGVPMLNGSYIALFMAVFWLIGKLWGNWKYK